MTLEMIWRKSEAQREKRTFLIFNYFNMIKLAFVESIFSGRGGPLIRIFQ